MPIERFLTDFADQAVMLPVVVAVTITLALLRRARLALTWVLALGGVFATVLLLKLAGYACEQLYPALPPAQLGLVTPSGHVAAGATIYGGMLGILFSDPARGLRAVIRRSCLLALGVAVVVGVTRVLLGEHTVVEAIVGGAVGVGGAAALAALTHPRLQELPRAAVLGVTVAVVVLFYGSHLSWENAIRTASAEAVRGWAARD